MNGVVQVMTKDFWPLEYWASPHAQPNHVCWMSVDDDHSTHTFVFCQDCDWTGLRVYYAWQG
jgi:hypothetical protein